MNVLATSTVEVWSVVGVTLVTVALLVPGVVYAWYVLETWIGDGDSYANALAPTEKH